MILESIGNKVCQHLAMIEAGCGSSEQDLIVPDLINLKTYSLIQLTVGMLFYFQSFYFRVGQHKNQILLAHKFRN